MDVVVQLPLTRHGKNTILVVVDRLTKMVHLAANTTTLNAEGTAKLFVDHVIKLHGWPIDMVLHKDRRFAGNFIRELNQLGCASLSRSTAFLSQSDGQTRRMNHTLEDMLRHYMIATHDDLDELLPMTEIAINNATSRAFKIPPSC